MTTLGTGASCTTKSSRLSAQSMQAKLCKWPTCIALQGCYTLSSMVRYTYDPRALNVILNLLQPQPRQPNARLSKQGTVPRVSRHLSKSANFRPLLPSDAFLVTGEYCQRQNRPWLDCKYKLAKGCKQVAATRSKFGHQVMMLLESFSSEFSPHIKIFSPHLPVRDLPTVTAPCISVPSLVQNSSIVQPSLSVPSLVQNSSLVLLPSSTCLHVTTTWISVHLT